MSGSTANLWRLAVATLLLLVIAAALIFVPEFGLAEFDLSPEAFVERIRGWGKWAMAGSMVLMVLHSFVPFPAECLAIANGMVFGWAGGIAVTWSGAMLGAWLAFGLSRWLGRSFVDRWLGQKQRSAIDGWTAEHGWTTLLTARLVPVIAFNLINYAAGLTRVSWWTFSWTTALGILPLTVLMVVVGDRMAEIPTWAWIALLPFAYVSWWVLRRMQLRAQPPRAP